MNLEKLKKMLESGAITQEEFDDMCEKLGLKEDEPEKKSDDDPLAGLDEKQKEAIQKLIQSERDRATNKLGNDKKSEIDKLKKDLKKLQEEKLTDEEKRKLEQDELEQQKREFAVMKNKYLAAQELKAADLDNGDDVVALVIGDDEDGTKANVKTLKAVVDRLVKAQVEKKFKDNGRDPGKGASGAGDDNPWSKDHYNFTRQMQIEISNPELARQLKAAAGVK